MPPPFALLSALILAATCVLLQAQTYRPDTAAVRVILSVNQIDLPAAEVAGTEQGRVVSLDLEGPQITANPRKSAR